MIKVGLTGGIGSGKTTVAEIFSRLGVPVFYADQEAKKIMVSIPEVKTGIIKLFGDKAYNGELLNREYIADKVFNDPVLLGNLNALVHPAVYSYFLIWAETFKKKQYVLLESAILLESGAKSFFDYIIIVTAPEEQRINRVVSRDKLKEEQVRERMRNQDPEEEKLALSDFIISNDNHSLIIPQILHLHKMLISLNK